MTTKTLSLRDRLERVIDRDQSGCWLFTLKLGKSEYGYLTVGPRSQRKSRLAHRVAYEVFVGPIPEGMQIDHLCRVRHCLNPEHLEAVTPEENRRRVVITPETFAGRTARIKATVTHCPRGHEYNETNTRVRGNWRDCKACAVLLRKRVAS